MEIRWHNELPADEAPFQQSAPYAQAVRRCGTNASWASVWDGSTQVGCALVLQRRGLRLISRGPLWSPESAPAQRCRALRGLARHPGLTLATAEKPLSGFGLVPLVTPLHHALWSLTPAPEVLLARMHGKWRNRLRAALGAGLRISEGTPAHLSALIEAEGAQRQTRRYRGLPGAFAQALDPDALTLLRWQDQGQMQAAMAFVRHGTHATYLLGWASPAARAAHAHNAMLWKAALALREAGVHNLDLGSLDTENAPGLARFKLGTGAALHRLGPTCLVLPG